MDDAARALGAGTGAGTIVSALEDLLGRAFDEHQGDLRAALSEAEYAKLRHAFVFHLTDWAEDLEAFHAMGQSPESWTSDRAMHFLIGMLYHVVPHLKAAGRTLLGEVPDHFEGDEIDQILTKFHSLPASAHSI